MGWMASWVGVQGVSRETVMEALSFEETGDMVEPGSRACDFSVGEVDDGWVIVFSEDFDWGTPARVVELSRLGPAVGLQFEDKVEMTSIACGAENGVELWRVSHVNEPGREIEVSGNPPAAFTEIRDRVLEDQEADKTGGVDYIHELPLEVAKSVCGYMADDWIPPFLGVKPIGAPEKRGMKAAPARAPSQGGGFFSRLFGRR